MREYTAHTKKHRPQVNTGTIRQRMHQKVRANKHNA